MNALRDVSVQLVLPGGGMVGLNQAGWRDRVSPESARSCPP